MSARYRVTFHVSCRYGADVIAASPAAALARVQAQWCRESGDYRLLRRLTSDWTVEPLPLPPPPAAAPDSGEGPSSGRRQLR